MDRLRAVVDNIARQLSGMSVTQRLLVGALATVVVMTLFIVNRYAGRDAKVELLTDYTPEQQKQAVAFLRTSGYDYEDRGGRIYVNPMDQYTILATMSEQDVLPDDTSILFGNLVEKQTMWQTTRQHRELSNIALQNELGRFLAKWRDIKDARVFIDAPEPNGLGGSTRRPTASVTLLTRSGGAIDQKTVDAAAEFISGAKAGLLASDVRVIDGTTGQQRRATSKEDGIPTTYIETQEKFEQRTRDKLMDLLSYIPGVVVAVTAQVDVSQTHSESTRYLEKNDGTVSVPAKSTSNESTSETQSNGGQPGLQSNVGMSINQGSGGDGSKTSEERREQEFESKIGHQSEKSFNPRGYPTRLVATINVPRGYVMKYVQATKPDQQLDPADPATQTLIDDTWKTVQNDIKASVKPHITIVSAEPGLPAVRDEDVQVALIPVDDAGYSGGGGSATGGGGGGGLGLVMGPIGNLIETIVIGVLAFLSLGMMVMMVKKATRPRELPSAEELAGVPPELRVDSELVGEVESGDLALSAIEVDEQEVRVDKMLDEISELAKTTPEEATKVLNTWLSNED